MTSDPQPAAELTLAPPDLTEFEQQELQDCESVVSYGIKMFMSACRALRTIRDKKLYRAIAPTWADYIAARWGSIFTDVGTADRWVNVAIVNENLEPVGVTIEHDRHARELVKYDGAIQQAVALVATRAADLEQKPVTESHFKHAGAVIGQMVTTSAVDAGVAGQHPITESLALSVVERRRESLLQHIKPRAPVAIMTQVARDSGWDASAQKHICSMQISGTMFEAGKRYEVKVFEVYEQPPGEGGA